MTGMTKLGVEKIPPLVGRGVLVDIAAYLGVKTLAPGQVIEAAQIKAAARQQGVSFKKGDIILLHTGYTDATLDSNPKQWGASIPAFPVQRPSISPRWSRWRSGPIHGA